jgi:K+-sensing histidine kinase KdpD
MKPTPDRRLRTPVTTIFGNATLLFGRAELGEREQAMIQDIVGDSYRLLRIVENLLQLTRLGAGTALDLEPQVLDHIVLRPWPRTDGGIRAGRSA